MKIKKYTLLMILILSTFFTSLVCANESAEQATLLRVSDCVMADKTFYLFGSGITDDMSVYVSSVNTASDINNSTSSNKTEVDIINIDEKGNFVQVLAPEEFSGSCHKIWLEINGSVVSNIMYINRSRPQWISDNIIASGSEVLISGRNMCSTEWNGVSNTQVRLVSGSNIYQAIVNSSNPYAVKFTVDNSVPDGTYAVETTNDGLLWSRLENNYEITVVRCSQDPLGLGVAWVNEFNWNNQVSITSYGAIANDGIDDTNAIKSAINAVSNTGGVVNIPVGNFHFRGVTLPANVVINGAGKSNTNLIYAPLSTNTNPGAAIKKATSGNGRQGIANLTISISDDFNLAYMPLNLVEITCGGASNYPDSRNEQYGFIKNVRIESSSEILPESAGKGAVCIIYKDHFLVDGCDFVGHRTNVTGSYIGKYLKYTNNISNTNVGAVYIHSQYSIFENNTITRNPVDGVTGNAQGIYTRSHSYLAGNTIRNTGNKTVDGEIIATEDYLGGTKMFGDVISATSETVTINPAENIDGTIVGSGSFASGASAWDLNKKATGDWFVVVVEGKGIGQSRAVTAAEETTCTLSISEPWEIIPDSTSKFVLLKLQKEITIYNNLVENCSWSLLFYGSAYDCVVADNILNNTNGIDFSIIQKITYETETVDCRVNIGYFNRICRNELSGVSPITGVSSISVYAKTNTDELFGRPILCTEIVDNTILGNGKTKEEILSSLTEDNLKTSYIIRNGINLLTWVSTGVRRHNVEAIECAVIEDNILSNLCDGITIGGARYSDENSDTYMKNKLSTAARYVCVRNNEFSGVLNEIREYTETQKPELVSSIPVSTTGDTYYDFVCYDNYMYVGSQRNGVLIYDISDIKNPVLIEQPESLNGVHKISSDNSMLIYNEELYVCYSTGIRRFSLSTPEEPVLIREYTNASNAKSIAIRNGYIYFAASQRYIRRLNISNGTLDTYSIANKAICIAIKDDLLFAGCAEGVCKFELNESDEPVLISSITTNEIFSVDIGNSFIVASEKSGSVHLLDINTFTDEVLQFENSALTYFGGYVEGDTLVLGGNRRGLYLYNISNIDNITTSGLYYNSMQYFNTKKYGDYIICAAKGDGLSIFKTHDSSSVRTVTSAVLTLLDFNEAADNINLTVQINNQKVNIVNDANLITTIKKKSQLLYIDVENTVLQSNTNKIQTIDVPKDGISSDCFIEIYLWSNFKNLVPLSDKIELNYSDWLK